MFPEYRDLISVLKNQDKHFAKLFDEHNELDHKIQNMIDKIDYGTPEEIETLKKMKLRLKDEMYIILKQYAENK
ncbi:YdcH family protein [Gallibacterium sp. AGMB14963]|uniref:YdcH family protein n=1 Tax=Gallibacterium faecale TaxID=3019086 RepID=UPI0022F19D5F|nr:YdcH family protein [Gallibacterium sp. AGMB14963]MDA3977570.1 YdcH family protein [Gallibacterium sp. AGMB14963]